MKLWEKGIATDKQIEHFTVGNDRELDLVLAKYDALGSIAHAKMLSQIGLLTEIETTSLVKALEEIIKDVEVGKFEIEDSFEDVHSKIEYLLTVKLGDAGKKIHTARSRNDQVLVDVHLYLKDVVKELKEQVKVLFDLLMESADKHQNVLLPGYTHLQIAMPSSFGLWFGSFAEGLTEDLGMLKAAFDLSNKNPLGSAAGYGSSFPLDRTLTTELLGFADLHHNVINAQNSRGKTERTLAFALAGIAGTLNKLATDVCLFMNQHFAFLTFPDNLTTGSSIMPHKKNPDVFELIRAKTNQIQAVPTSVSFLLTNMSTGYHRDMQLLKEEIFPAFDTLKSCLSMSTFMLKEIKVKQNILQDSFYKHLFSVEVVNDLVLQGVPFRDAYKKVGLDIEAGQFAPDQSQVNHSHEGSIGNLCLSEIKSKMKAQAEEFKFFEIDQSFQNLLK